MKKNPIMSTNIKISDVDIDKSQEPSVLSKDPKERKLARRLRIQRRSEAIRKQVSIVDEEIVEKSRTEKQIDASNEMMEKLIVEGDEVITNIRVANDAREIHRREEDIAIRDDLLNKLEEEAKESAKKYEEISAKWSSILASKDPLDIHAGIESQNAKCLEVFAEKDIIITQLKQELDNADKRFAADQKIQNEDINILIERIDNQTNIIAKAYRRELLLIEDVLKTERTTILKNITKKWDDLYNERQSNEMSGVERRREIMREYENEMNRVLIEHQEKYRAQKIWLETECEKLQQEVENMKALCMINIEKLDYSYAVLKRREDENKIVKNQQKRRINKLQDTVNDLKKNCAELEESGRLKIEKLQDQLVKVHKNMRELELKSNHFTLVNDKQYMQIWEMNTKNADKLVNEIMKVDKILYEQMLGLDWEPPKVTLLKKEDLPSYREAMSIIENRNDNKQEKIVSSNELQKEQQGTKSQETTELERKMLSHILNQISDQTGFFTEDKIRERLLNYSQINQTIIRLDNAFQALNIHSENQVYLLLHYFLPYSYCPTCKINEDETTSTSEDSVNKISEKETVDNDSCPCDIQDLDEPTDRLVKEIMKHISLEPQTEIQNDNVPIELANKSFCITEEGLINDGEFSAVAKIDQSDRTDAERQNFTCSKGHLLEIESTNIIKALREFVKNHNEVNDDDTDSQSNKQFHNKITLSRSISEKDMIEYWQRYRDIFSPEKEKLWDALTIGLNKYHEILKERQKLITDSESLRQQNSELKRLLETCKVKSNVCSPKRGTRSAYNRTA
ncbi:hypothetical protein PV327_005813 [Microctonus hyperodae]|uniref:Dynein regulatory complex protein 1 n=1 Tax=Microctonus hyperodae TaxID=165561 RepID=A0AA39G2L5_MICHY|nr:hypothetical protein PV327_005813 [Microctonus hyperodae]